MNVTAMPDVISALEDSVMQFVQTDDELREIASRHHSDDDGKPLSRHWAQKILNAKAALAKARGEPVK